jgi:hypothetical protein
MSMYYQLRHMCITFRRTGLWSLWTYLFRNSLVRIRIQNTIQSVIFKLVSKDLHLLFRYFRISQFLVRASTENTNWLSKQCCPRTRVTSETYSSHITPVVSLSQNCVRDFLWERVGRHFGSKCNPRHETWAITRQF